MSTPASDGTATATRNGTPPGPRGRLLMGSMRDFQRDSLGFIEEVALRHGDVVRYRMATMWWHQVNHPEGVRRVLQENNHNYPKSDLTASILRPVAGEGLFISEGKTWLRQRRLMQPAFHRQKIAAFGELMTNAAQKMMGRWDHRIDAAAEMTRLTLDVATDALFHAHVGGEPTTIARAVSTLLAEINYRFQVPFYPPINVPTPRNRRMRHAIRTLDRAMYDIIEQRRRDGEEGDDLLSMLMAARDEETGAAMSDRQLRDEVITLFIAGHDTTANALTWTFYLLATHPEADERLRAELDEVLDGAVPAFADLPKLPYSRMVIEEAMRLYPPAWITDRQAVKEDEILGHRIPAGGHVIISPYVTHRLPTLWENPDNFDPGRFSPEKISTRPRYAYFPFGGGPRQCIGKGMALMEAHLILATVMQRYRLRLAADQPVEPEPTVTLRPRGGLPMTVEPVS